MGKIVNLIFPHQLLANSPLLENGQEVFLVEEFLFFKQYKFHQQKIAFHRASMQYFRDFLLDQGIKVNYIEASDPLSDIRNFSEVIAGQEIAEIHLLDLVDDWLEQRIKTTAPGVKLVIHNSPSFLNNRDEVASYFKKDRSRFFQTDFYKKQRRKLNLLLDEHGEPIGGQWTFDTDNRKKYPKGKTPTPIHYPRASKYWTEAVAYTKENFSDNPGKLDENRIYPVTHTEAEDWFRQFLEFRFHEFGPYEDAIVSGQSILNHSLLSPLLNSGLLEPQKIISETISFAENSNIPLNSTEGFIRQIIGWREFIRGMYRAKGRFSRTRNFWGFTNKIPASFYDGTTGIKPVDETIKRLLETGYSHHIERLMILGNFMLLCEIDPDEVYRWFMELYIDAYDWVMVPNIYGMSQFADGGSFATKPYIAGSNYLRKMSNYPTGDWQTTWDGLFWRFIVKHGEFFKANPRLSMMYHSSQRMAKEKLTNHLAKAEEFLAQLHS